MTRPRTPSPRTVRALPAPYQRPAQPPLPPGRHQGMGRTGDRILRDSQARGKKAELIIGRFAADPRPIACGSQTLHQHEPLAQGALQGRGQALKAGQEACRGKRATR